MPASLVVAKDAVEALEAGDRLPQPTARAALRTGDSVSRPGASCIVALVLIAAGAVAFTFVAAG